MSSSTSKEQIAQQIIQHVTGLTNEQARKLAEIAQERTFAAGDVVFNEGDPATDLYLLLEGCIFLGARFSKRMGLVTFASLGPGDFFGWSAVVPPHRKTAHADVIRPARVLIFKGTELLALCEADKVLGYTVMRHLLATVGKRLVATRQRILDMLN